MHRLPSISAVRRIRIAALLLGAKCLITPVAAGILAWSFVIGDMRLTAISVAMLVLAGMMLLLQWMISARATCPLCLTPVIGTKECMKHRSARKFLGSHRLRVSAEVLFLNRFRCPYCGEHCEVKVRARKLR